VSAAYKLSKEDPARTRAVDAALLGAAETPLATARAAAPAREAWEGAGRPGALLYFSDDPDPVAVRLDLRPWGGDRLALVEEGAAGLPPRADLFPSGKPLA